MTVVRKPPKHPLKQVLKNENIPIYTLKYLLGEDYPSRSELWLMLNGYKDMPTYVLKGIKQLLSLEHIV